MTILKRTIGLILHYLIIMYFGYTKIVPVVIGNHVFIGQNAIILPGVTIGDDVIIGAGSVMTKDITSGSGVAGNPAKCIGKTNEDIEKNKQQLKHSPVFNSTFAKSKLDTSQIDLFQARTRNCTGFIV